MTKAFLMFLTLNNNNRIKSASLRSGIKDSGITYPKYTLSHILALIFGVRLTSGGKTGGHPADNPENIRRTPGAHMAEYLADTWRTSAQSGGSGGHSSDIRQKSGGHLANFQRIQLKGRYLGTGRERDRKGQGFGNGSGLGTMEIPALDALKVHIENYRVFWKNCVFSQFTATPPSPTSL